MKRILAIAFAASCLYACGDATTNDTVSDDRDDAPISSPANTPNSDVYTPAEGDITYREDKIRVWRDGNWTDNDEEEVRLSNGAVVYRDGRVVRDDKEVELEEGEVVNRSGDFFDRSGKAIEKAWDDVKEGAKATGKDIEKGAKKVGEKVEDAVDGDK